MSTEQNKTLARRWLEEVINRKNLTAVDELFATNWQTGGIFWDGKLSYRRRQDRRNLGLFG